MERRWSIAGALLTGIVEIWAPNPARACDDPNGNDRIEGMLTAALRIKAEAGKELAAEQARAYLDLAQHKLACTQTITPADLIARLALASALSYEDFDAFNLGAHQFERAFAVASDVVLEPISDADRSRVARAQAEHAPRPTVRLRVESGSPRLAVDGDLLPEGEHRQVSAGDHFVQVEAGDGSWDGWWVTVPAVAADGTEGAGAVLIPGPEVVAVPEIRYRDPRELTHAKVPVEDSPPPEPTGSVLRWAPTGALIAGSLTAAVIWGRAYQAYEDGACAQPTTSETYEACGLIHDRESGALGAAIGLGAGAITTAALTLVLPRTRSNRETDAEMAVSLVAAPSPSLGLHLRF